MADDGIDRPIAFDTLGMSMVSLARMAEECRQIGAAMEAIAKDAAAARGAWKRHLAKVVYSSTEKSSDKREAQAMDSPEGAALYDRHLETDAVLVAATERLRGVRAVLSAAMTATAVHRSELEALHVEVGLADER